jgi:hypothetical protein
MSEHRPSPPPGLIWGKVLTWVGLLVVLAGGVLATVITFFMGVDEGAEAAAESFAVSTLCCSGPVAFVGFIMFIVGVVLWTTNRP